MMDAARSISFHRQPKKKEGKSSSTTGRSPCKSSVFVFAGKKNVFQNFLLQILPF